MPLNSRYGTSTPDGKTVPGQKRIDRLAAQAAALAAKRPTQSTVESMEQAEVVVPAPEEELGRDTAGSSAGSSAGSDPGLNAGSDPGSSAGWEGRGEAGGTA